MNLPRRGRPPGRTQGVHVANRPRPGGGHHNPNLAKTAGFSLHAGVAAKAHQRPKLERLCQYIARPAVATDRLALTPQGNVRYGLKTPYRDDTTHIILEPLDFIARLAALVPKPRVNLTRFHGVFAPNSALRQQVTPARRGKLNPIEAKTPAQRRAAMTWAQRLKRVFKIDIETYDQCGGTVKVIACIEDSAVVKRILDHIEQQPDSKSTRSHPARAPPAGVQRDGSCDAQVAREAAPGMRPSATLVPQPGTERKNLLSV